MTGGGVSNQEPHYSGGVRNELPRVPDVPGSVSWRHAQLSGLMGFARRSRVERGFGWLDADGQLLSAEGLHLWINARMTYVFSLASLTGDADALDLAEHGVRTLLTTFADVDHDGWYNRVAADGGVLDDTKSCYAHCFVLLAACAAHRAGVARADDLLARAVDVQERYFWDADAGRCREQWNRDWSRGESYRGANSNMHAVEAYLLASDATAQGVWLDRALEIVRHLAGDSARGNDWRVLEHFDENWGPLPDYNADRPNDPFRPHGATPGHGFEWARLVIELEQAHPDPPDWMLEVAEGLFDRAASDTDEGRTGFCYTTDWHGAPVVRERFHWVQCEALLAADTLGHRTRDLRYTELASRWWRFADEHFVDREAGSWHHELDRDLKPSATTWRGKPDAYHVFNALTRAGRPGTAGRARSHGR